MDFQFLHSPWFTFAVVPVLIFFARICDVTLGTIRIIFISRGKKVIAPILGFFDSLIWILATTQIMKNLNSPICFIAYASGFACGTFVGILVEEKLAIGTLIIRIILPKDDCNLVERLSEAGYGVTIVDAHGAHGEVKLIYTLIKRKCLKHVEEIINMCNSKAFYSVEDARDVYKGVFPVMRNRFEKEG